MSTMFDPQKTAARLIALAAAFAFLIWRMGLKAHAALDLTVRAQDGTEYAFDMEPTDRVEPPRVIPQEARFYTPEELRQLFALVEGHWLEPIVKLAGALGLRREEICGLRWSSVDFARRRVHIKVARTAAGASIVQKETKNRTSNRVLHLGDELCRLLRQERSAQVQRSLARGDGWSEDNFVAVDKLGKPYSPNAVSLAFTRFIRSHGMPKITLHGLRHPYVKHTTKNKSLQKQKSQAINRF